MGGHNESRKGTLEGGGGALSPISLRNEHLYLPGKGALAAFQALSDRLEEGGGRPLVHLFPPLRKRKGR